MARVIHGCDASWGQTDETTEKIYEELKGNFLLKSSTWVCELRGGLLLGWGSGLLEGDSQTAEEAQMQTFGCHRKLPHTC